MSPEVRNKINLIIPDFLKWYESDSHSQYENFYKNEITYEYLKNLTKKEFIDFFISFAVEGGKVQSGGQRTAPKLKDQVSKNFQEFQSQILNVFLSDFNLNEWLIWVEKFTGFGQGLATIFLNRVDKHKFSIVNNKAIDGLKELGFTIKSSGGLKNIYKEINVAQEQILKEFPVLDNYFRVDALMHYVVVHSGLKDVKLIELSPGTSIFKISMSPKKGEVSEEQYQFALNNNIICIGKDTKALATKKERQAELFTDTMKIGDNFYLCRGNKFIELFGKITGNVEEFKMPGLQNNDWLQRSFSKVVTAAKRESYKGIKKWWAPNFHSTFVKIPEHDIELANENIFIPFFNSKISFSKMNQNNTPLNTILFGPPGTGKTYHTVSKAVSIANPDFDISQSRDKVKDEYDRLVRVGRIVFTTFHQSMCYEDFVEGIKPKMQQDTNDLQYEIKSGIFKSICDVATGGKEASFDKSYEKFIEELTLKGQIKMVTPSDKKAFLVKKSSVGNCSVIPNTEKASEMTITKSTIHKIFKDPNETMWRSYSKPIADYIKENYYDINVDASKSNFVLIIDEINRGNVASIFGELITLIEKDKRAGMDEALEVVLPYSKEKFSVPQNLYIIGTMNTADRSIEALDTALRRRFVFEEITTDALLIKTEGALRDSDGMLGEIDLVKMLETINARIEKLIDKDHKIGHSYFLKIITKKDLDHCFQNQVIPLLEEYFFGDFGKIGLILGNSFIEKQPDIKDVFFKFSGYDNSVVEDLKARPVYKYKPVDEWDYISIYNVS